MNTTIPFAPSANTGQFAVAVTPSDTVSSAVAFRALWVGGAGNVSIQFPDGTNALFSGVPAGTMLPVGGVRVNSALGGTTTATLILAIY